MHPKASASDSAAAAGVIHLVHCAVVRRLPMPLAVALCVVCARRRERPQRSVGKRTSQPSAGEEGRTTKRRNTHTDKRQRKGRRNNTMGLLWAAPAASGASKGPSARRWQAFRRSMPFLTVRTASASGDTHMLLSACVNVQPSCDYGWKCCDGGPSACVHVWFVPLRHRRVLSASCSLCFCHRVLRASALSPRTAATVPPQTQPQRSRITLTAEPMAPSIRLLDRISGILAPPAPAVHVRFWSVRLNWSDVRSVNCFSVCSHRSERCRERQQQNWNAFSARF